MKIPRHSRLALCPLLIAAFAAPVRAQQAPRPAGAPPKFLNMVHEEFKPGRESAYAALEASIVRGYSRAKIPVYWLFMQSFTGPSKLLAFNFFDSFAELEKTAAAYGAGLTAHPELAQQADRLLQENIIRVTTVFTMRRDDLGYRANTIDFSKMRVLRVVTYRVRPAHEGEFVEAATSVASACEKAHSDSPWAVYQVDSGLPSPTFVVLLPMRSLKDGDTFIAQQPAIRDAEGEPVEARLQEIARAAFDSTESQLFFVAPTLSHMPKEFSAADAGFWTPKHSDVASEKETAR